MKMRCQATAYYRVPGQVVATLVWCESRAEECAGSGEHWGWLLNSKVWWV